MLRLAVQATCHGGPSTKTLAAQNAVATLDIQVSEADYARATAFVPGHLRRLSRCPTPLAPWSIIATLLYTLPLFAIVTAPNGLDDRTRLILRGAVLCLLLVPALFVFGIYRLRKADASALQRLEPRCSMPTAATAAACAPSRRWPACTTQWR